MKTLRRNVLSVVSDFMEASENAAGDFALVEQAIEFAFRRMRGLFVTAGLTVASEELPTFHCPSCSKQLSPWQRGPRRVVTAQGEGTYPSVRYRCNDCAQDHYPLEKANGLDGDQYTTGAKAVIAEAAADLPFAHVAEHLGQSRGIGVSAKEVDRTAREVASWRAEEEEELVGAVFGDRACQARLQDIDPLVSTPNLYPMEGWGPDTPALISVDGALVRSSTKGPSGLEWFECRAGIISPIGPDDRAGKAYLGGIMRADDIFDLLAAAWRRGDNAKRLCVFVADGAQWIWNRVPYHFPGAIEVLDFYHACEHVDSAANAIWGEGNTKVKEWKSHARKTLLKPGGQYKILRELADAIRAKDALNDAELQKEFRYLYGHRHRMRYAALEARGLPIGSGEMESSIKQTSVRRLRQAGMKWTRKGAHAIMQLRCATLTGTLTGTTNRKHQSLQETMKSYLPSSHKAAA
jgi:hypothetical protein